MSSMRSFRPRSISAALTVGLRLGLAAAPMLCAAPLASAQGAPDFSVPFGAQVIQSIQYGFTPLVAGKTTFVRALVQATGTVPPGTTIDGVMRVFVGGVEQPYSPIYSDNGPITPPVAPQLGNENDSLNFVFLPPVANDVAVRVEINPAGPTQVPESTFSNNVAFAGPLAFACREPAELVYVPIDYQPSGPTPPNPPDPFLIEPGMGDNFVEGIYAVGDWNYHRSVAPSKLWTSSVASSGSGLLSSLAVDQQLMVPVPNFIYGFVPGGLSYNGLTISIPGTVAMGNTEPIRYQRTIAHELGHCFGLTHNSTTVNAVGVDGENQLNLPLVLATIKDASLKDVMYPGLLTQEAWVAENTFMISYNSAHLSCAADQDSGAPGPRPSLLVAGLWDRAAGTIDATDVLRLEDGTPTPGVPVEQADLVVLAYAGARLAGQCALPVGPTADCGGEDHGTADGETPPSALGAFAAVIAPAAGVGPIDRVQVLEPRANRVLWELRASPSAPQVSFLPARSADAGGAVVALAWQGSDADGDALHYYLRYSPDGVRKVPLGARLAATEQQIDLSQLPELQPERGYFELLASDGLHTATARLRQLPSAALSANGGGNAPWVYLATPDPFLVYPKGATVVLHANAWDLEDLFLDGPSVTWTSNLDGPIGTGRLTSVADLSLGTHTITVAATDSASNVSIDTVQIRIINRVLPGAICQSSLGFGGPGSSALTMCGGNLSTGTTADLKLTGALPGALAWMLVGASSNPTPLLGGTVVPLPIGTMIAGATSGTGTWTFAGIAGGGGPNTVYVQAAYVDLAQPELAAFSNALKVDFLP